jgi:hypothetical protein
MNDFNLPHELAAFEAELQSLPRVQMPSALRERVLADMHTELTSPTITPAALSTANSLSTRWWFAACAATVAMLWLNLSLVTARNVGEARPQAETLPTAATLAETQARLAALLPELSPAESQRYALTLYSGSQATLLPVPMVADTSLNSAEAY